MEDEILKYLINKQKHLSSCLYPENDCDCSKIDTNTKLFSGGYLDSISLFEFIIFIENEFNIKIRDNDISPMNFNNIKDIVKIIKKYKE